MTRPSGHTTNSLNLAQSGQSLDSGQSLYIDLPGIQMHQIVDCLSHLFQRNSRQLRYTLVKTYRAVSSASVDELWRQLSDLTDVSWHPLFARTNVPRGLRVKPGLIYQAVTRLCPIPIPIQVFVERVRPRELLSFRILSAFGVEEQSTYHVEETGTGSYVSYSVMLRGWLSPVIWSLIQPHAARVAARLAQAAEKASLTGNHSPRDRQCFDF